MSDCRQRRTMLLADIHDHDHVWQFGTGFDIEPIMGLLRRHSRRKGAERLTFLNHGVDSIAHFRMTRIGKNAAVPESARPKFHPPAVPCDNASAGNPIRSFGTRHFRAGKMFHVDVTRVFVERSGDFVVCRSRTKEWHRHTTIAHAVVRHAPLQSRAECSAVIAGSGLNINLVEEPRAHQFSVRSAIERNPAGQREPSNAGLPLKMAANVKHRNFEPFLKRSGKITMAGCDFFITLPSRSELLFEETPRRYVVVALFPSAVQPQCGNADRSVVAKLDLSFEKSPVPGRIAVRRQSHDLVFIAIEIES